MKQVISSKLFIDGVEIGEVVGFDPPQKRVEPIRIIGRAKIQWGKPRWATPRNSEKWQGCGKRRKPKLK